MAYKMQTGLIGNYEWLQDQYEISISFFLRFESIWWTYLRNKSKEYI